MALDRNILNKIQLPKNSSPSGVIGGLTAGSARQDAINKSIKIGGIKTVGIELFSNKSLDKLEKNKQVIGVGQSTPSVNIANIGGGFGTNSQPANKVESFLKQIKTTTDQSFAKSIAQANSSTEAYSVGGGQTRHEQIKADEKVTLQQKQDQVVKIVDQKRQQAENKLGEKQAVLYNSQQIAKDVGFTEQKVKNNDYVELPQLNQPEEIDYKTRSSDVTEIGATIIDKIVGDVVEMTTARIAAALKVKRPIVGDKGCALDVRGNYLIPEDNVHSYEFYVEVDPSVDQEVFDYILKYRSKIDDKKWFSFYIGGVGYTQTPSWVSLNYGVPPTRFSTDKVLYFFVKVKSGKAIDTVKNFYFYDTTAKTNTPDAKHLVLKGIKVYYKKEAGQYYYTPETYDKKVAGNEPVDQRESIAVSYQGTLSKENPVDSNKNEIEKIAEGIKSSKLSEANQPQGKAIAVGESSNKQEAKTVGEHDGTKVGGEHEATTHQGGAHEFHAHSTAATFDSFSGAGVGALAVGAKIGSGILIGATASGAMSVGTGALQSGVAAAVGSSGQGIRDALGNSIQAYQSSGFQQQGSFGTSNFGRQSIRGITSLDNLQSGLRAGQTVIAGSDSDSVLFFAQPGQEKEFAQFQNPHAGIGQVTIIPTELDGSINQKLLSPAARASLSSINNSAKSSGGNYGSSNLSNTGAGGKPVGGRKFGSGVSGLGGNGGNKPPRRPGLGGLEDLPDKPEDENENNLDNLRKLGLGFGASDLDGENSFQIDGEPENVEDQIYENGINLVSDRPKTGGRVRIDKDPDGKNAFKNLPKKLREQRINDIKNNPAAKARQGQNAFGEKYKREALDRVKNKLIDNLVKKGIAQAGAFLGGLLVNPITWVILAALFLTIVFVGGAVASECRPEGELKKLRNNLVEPAALLTEQVISGPNIATIAQAGISNAVNLTPVGLIYNALRGEGPELPKSGLRKAIEALPGCSDTSNLCAQSGAGDAANSLLSGAINGCFDKTILEKPEVEFIKAQGLVKYQAKTTKIKEIIEAGQAAGVPDVVIKWVIALSPTESDMSWDQYGSAEDCYGIIQFCRSKNGSCTFQNALYNVDKFHGTDQVKDLESACDTSLSPSMSKLGTEIKGDKVLQMKMAWAGYKLKKAIIKSSCKLWADQSEIYRISAAWLGCSSSNDIGGTSPINYGKAGENNFKAISCKDGQDPLGSISTTSSSSKTVYLDTRQQDQANKYWSEAFGFPVLAKVGEQIKNPVLTGLQVLDQRILAFNRVMEGKVSVEAATDSTSSSAVAPDTSPGSDDAVLRTQLATRITTGKIRVWTRALGGGHEQSDYITDTKEVNIELIKMILAMSDKYDLFLTALGKNTHSPGSQHEAGEAVDIGSIEKANSKVDNSDPKLLASFVDEFYSSSFIKQLLASNELSSRIKAAGAKATFGNYNDGPGHLHFGIVAGAKWGGASPSSSSSSSADPCVCPDGSSGNGISGKVDLQNAVSSKTIEEIIKKYGGHSAVAQRVSDGKVEHYNGDQPPDNVASTIKSVVTVVVIEEQLKKLSSSGVNESTLILLPNELKGGETEQSGNTLGSKISIKDAVTYMLSNSSNATTNALVYYFGGGNQSTFGDVNNPKEKFTSLMQQYGFTTMEFNRYLNLNGGRGTSGEQAALNQKRNKGTALDITKAMYKVFQDPARYKLAANALENAEDQYDIKSIAQSEGVKNIANKWGGVKGDDPNISKPGTSNIAVFEIDSKKYVIGAYINGNFTLEINRKNLRDINKEIIQLIKNKKLFGETSTTSISSKSTSFFDFPNIFGGITASAQNVESNEDAALRTRLLGLYTSGEVMQLTPITKDTDYIKIQDINSVKFLLSMYDSGIVWVSGPKNFGRNYGAHQSSQPGIGQAIDFWGLGYKADFKGDKIKGYTWDGVMTGSRGTGAVPSAKGNEADLRIYRMVDIESPNAEISGKVGEIFKKVIDLAYDNKAVLLNRKNTLDVFANNTFAAKYSTSAKPIYNESVAPFHHHHLHLGITSSSKGAITFNGSTSGSNCKCQSVSSPTTTSSSSSSVSGSDTGSGSDDQEGFLNIFGAIKANAAGDTETEILAKKVDLVKSTNFTNEEKAFLDVIANQEEGIYTSLLGVGSANNKGKYQIGEGDKPEATTALKAAGYNYEVKADNWDAENQDYLAVGRTLRNAQIKRDKRKLSDILKGDDGFNKALGYASMEFQALPEVPGYKHSGNKGQPNKNYTIAVAKKFYDQRLALYGGTSSGSGECSKSSSSNNASLPADFGEKIVKAMKAKGYKTDVDGKKIDIIYLRGMDTSGNAKTRRVNAFDDIRVVIEYGTDGKAKVAGAWEASILPGKKYYESGGQGRTDGAFMIDNGQFKKAWQVGIHGGRGGTVPHKGLLLKGNITGTRDANRNGIKDDTLKVSGSGFEVNQHWGYDQPSDNVDDGSAGCLVGRLKAGHEEFIKIVEGKYSSDFISTTIMDGIDIK